jgi:hypothetical protein
MPHKHTHPFQSVAGWSLLALALPLLWWVSHPVRQIVIEPMMFVFWHTAVEVFAVVLPHEEMLLDSWLTFSFSFLAFS